MQNIVFHQLYTCKIGMREKPAAEVEFIVLCNN